MMSRTKGSKNKVITPLQVRLDSRIEPVAGPLDTPCLIWTGGKDSNGYGYLNVDGKCVKTHRLSYELKFGKIPDDLFCLHKCDVPACTNTDHLFIGTQQDNMTDKMNKGRHGLSNLRGEQIGTSKLVREDVLQIHQMINEGHTQKSIAEVFDVNQSQISVINTGKQWKHLNIAKEYNNV